MYIELRTCSCLLLVVYLYNKEIALVSGENCLFLILASPFVFISGASGPHEMHHDCDPMTTRKGNSCIQ